MEQRSQYDEIIVKYLSGNVSEEEFESVRTWINSNAENRAYFKTLMNAWRMTALKDSLEAIRVEEEWQKLEQRIDLNAEDTSEKLTAIDDAPQRTGTFAKVLKMAIAAAVAASIIVLIVRSGSWFGSTPAPDQPAAVVEQAQTGRASSTYTRHERNNSGQLKKFLLPDGTEVLLSDKSEISFQEPFHANRRDIILSGKAFFNVAKEKSRPFTVYSGNLSTTVLGTKFTVSSFAHDSHITIRLYEGKVMVKINYNQQRSFQHDYYLSPGHELIYDNLHSSARVRRFKENGPVAGERTLNEDSVFISTQPAGSWFMFNNQSLEDVFDQLEAMYHIDIEYSKKDVRNMYFIARFEKGYALDNILQQIALLNHLQIVKKNDRYIVTK